MDAYRQFACSMQEADRIAHCEQTNILAQQETVAARQVEVLQTALHTLQGELKAARVALLDAYEVNEQGKHAARASAETVQDLREELRIMESEARRSRETEERLVGEVARLKEESYRSELQYGKPCSHFDLRKALIAR